MMADNSARASTESVVTKTVVSQTTTPAQESRQESPDDVEGYPNGAKLGLIILALCLAVFLMALE
jgi:hypothetical protein